METATHSLATGSSRHLRRACVTLAALALGLGTACATQPAAPPPAKELYTSYEVGAPDRLRIVIQPEPVLSESVVVRPDGMLSIQLLGDVPAGGRTLPEIASDIEQRISRYKRDARVTVILEAAESTAITLLGEVNRPSSFPLVKETRIAEAIGHVGGTTLFANMDDIRLIRHAGSETFVYAIDMAAIQKGDLRTNVVLSQGDIIYVPPTIWARVGYAVNALLFPISPLFGFATGVASNMAAP